MSMGSVGDFFRVRVEKGFGVWGINVAFFVGSA